MSEVLHASARSGTPNTMMPATTPIFTSVLSGSCETSAMRCLRLFAGGIIALSDVKLRGIRRAFSGFKRHGATLFYYSTSTINSQFAFQKRSVMTAARPSISLVRRRQSTLLTRQQDPLRATTEMMLIVARYLRPYRRCLIDHHDMNRFG